MKVALFAFNGEAMCFVHVLLNALDFNEKGKEVKVIIEGSATKLLYELAKPDMPFHNLYVKVKDAGLIDGVCKACAAKMNTLEEAEKQGLALLSDMQGHPSMAEYMKEGYQIITF